MKKQKLNPRINLFLDAVKLLKNRRHTNFDVHCLTHNIMYFASAVQKMHTVEPALELDPAHKAKETQQLDCSCTRALKVSGQK